MSLQLRFFLLVYLAGARQIHIPIPLQNPYGKFPPKSHIFPTQAPIPSLPGILDNSDQNWRIREGLIFPMRGHAPSETGGRPVPLYSNTQVPYEQIKDAERFGMDLNDPIARMCCPGDRSNFFHNVSQPHFVPFLNVEGTRETDAGVLVLPGGGFHFMAWEKEGTDIAVWLNSIGIRAFVLKYRVPNRGWVWSAALQDAQRAMSLIRASAFEFGINPRRIGTIGFSAGGKLALDLSSSVFRTYPPHDQADNERWHPNFQMIIYGWGDPWNPMGPKPPPTFFTIAEDDQCVPVGDVRRTAKLMKDAGGIVKLDVYPDGRHGYGRCSMYTQSGNWHSVCEWPHYAEGFLIDHVLNDPETADPMYRKTSDSGAMRAHK